jgi:hypothetical protein
MRHVPFHVPAPQEPIRIPERRLPFGMTILGGTVAAIAIWWGIIWLAMHI